MKKFKIKYLNYSLLFIALTSFCFWSYINHQNEKAKSLNPTSIAYTKLIFKEYVFYINEYKRRTGHWPESLLELKHNVKKHINWIKLVHGESVDAWKQDIIFEKSSKNITLKSISPVDQTPIITVIDL